MNTSNESFNIEGSKTGVKNIVKRNNNKFYAVNYAKRRVLASYENGDWNVAKIGNVWIRKSVLTITTTNMMSIHKCCTSQRRENFGLVK